MTQVNYPTSIHTYTLDKVGNRKSEVIDNIGQLNTRTYGYNTRDQLKTITDTDGLDISYDYDDAGNQTQKTENGVTTTFNYTPRQRVKTITVGGAPPVEYKYDYAGQRVNYQYNGAEKRYLYDGLTLIAETNTLGNTLATYHYGTTRQLAETRNGQNAFYLADVLGTNVAITNQDGSIQNRMDYDVWGNLKQESASSDSPFGFTGYIKDQETDLYYANARYYDSFTGRFLREDPFEGDFNTPPSLHRYLYAHANPTYHTDPTGKCSIKFYRCQMEMMKNENNAEDIDRLLKVRDEIMAERVGEPTTLAYIVGATSFLGESVVETGKFAADFIGNAFGHKGSEIRFSDRVGQTVDFLTNNPWETAQAALTDELYEIHLLEQAGKQTEANVRKGRLGAAFVSALTGPKAISSKKGGARRVEEGADNNVELKPMGAPEQSRQRAELRNVDTSDFTTGQKGDHGELITQTTMQRAGYAELPARLSRNNGFDGVWVKYNSDGSVNDIVITETKFSSTGKASLTNTKTMGKQLSTEWINENINKMLDSDDLDVVETGYLLFQNSEKLRKKAAVVTPDGQQRFNKIKIPDSE